MHFTARCRQFFLAAALLPLCASASADTLKKDIQTDYDKHLGALFEHFHRNPELSTMENKTAARLAEELRDTGFEVTEGVGGTGIVALMENGPGPLVMMRADMDGLPVEEKSGLSYASRAKQNDWNDNEVFVMHACGHDVHITSLVGTARRMANMRDHWSGTLMLIGQPAEEAIGGAKMMMDDGVWKRFGQPDYAMAFHVSSNLASGKLMAVEGSPYSGVDSVDLLIHGVGGHGASPHTTVDPVVLGSQIVVALQTVISRTLAPREPGVITVGSFHAGTKHNIISDQAKLQITVRNESEQTRKLLLDGIRRISENLGRAAGLPEDKLPEVRVRESDNYPPTLNDIPLTRRLRGVWTSALGDDILVDEKRKGMGAEDFPFFVTDPYIPSTYFAVGGTPEADFERARNGGAPVPSHHSPIFKVEPEAAVNLGVHATVLALIDLMPPK
ncbi:MAG: amidohydrolase [Gammaproteobacteria bacterium]